MTTGSYFSKLFGSSPTKPLQQHMEKVYQCAKQLVTLFDAVFDEDDGLILQTQQNIGKLENEADLLKKQLRLQLPNRLMLAMERGDLLELLRVQDEIANKAKDIAGLVMGRKMRFPASLAEEMKRYVQKSVKSVAQARKVINELDELIETGFRGYQVELVNKSLDELDQMETGTDEIQVNLRGILFEKEKDLPPVDVMFMYKIIELIGNLANEAERVGKRLELLLAK